MDHNINDGTNYGKISVIASGYQNIYIPKSGLSFPAWLVRFPCRARQDHDEHIGCLHPFYWRSKRDFLVLSRASVRSNCARLPKAAFDKLSKKAPWRRSVQTQQKMELVDQFIVGTGTKSNPAKNYYHVSMKKSLYQLDQFLQAIQLRVYDKMNDADHTIMLQDTNDSNSSKDRHLLVEAWRDFCRPQDTTGLVKINSSDGGGNGNTGKGELDGQELQPSPITKNLSTSLKESARLGQYFCTDENADKLVHTVLQGISDKFGTCHNIVIIEPSCGKGDVIWRLLELLPSKATNVRVVGCDIDPYAIRSCQQRMDTVCTAGDTTSSAKETVHVEVTWMCKDFLKSQPCDIGLQPCDVVVCLGGPPYTTGAGSGSTIERDLPQLFLWHCLEAYRAELVAFFLPRRYQSKPMRAERNKEDFPSSSKWSCVTQELSSSTFYFQGTTPVIQPSVLQTFHRTYNGSN